MSGGRHDFAILGGGCAGLSLALELLEAGPPDARIVVIDPRTDHRRDRTFCFWEVAPHRFDDAVVRRYRTWRLRSETRRVLRRSRRYAYAEVDSGRFYESALSRLRGSGRVDLLLGEAAHELREQDDCVEVRTASRSLEAGLVFDGRPPPPPPPGALLQHFVGQELEVDRPVFEPGCATLMDFGPASDDEIRFHYVLPRTPTRALVESTSFSTGVLAPEVHRERIHRHLDERHGVAVREVSYEERGVIPMHPLRLADESRPDGRVRPIGARAGLVKPSTGYAFLAIQRHVRALVEALPHPPQGSWPRSRVSQWMDVVFLERLRSRPSEAPVLFAELFERVEPDALVRFLSDVPRPSDRFAVMAALPAAPMLAAALRSLLPSHALPPTPVTSH